MNNRKGQAALEFLMTYGWAILVVLVAIGALAYFGVLSPDKFLPSTCTLPPGIGCADFQVIGDTVAAGATNRDDVNVVLRNGLGDTISVTNVEVEGCDVTNSEITSVPVDILNGAESTFAINCKDAADAEETLGQPGERFTGELIVSYTTDSGLNKVTRGTLAGQLE